MDQREPAGPVRMPSFLRTHPYNADRDAAIRELAQRLQAERPNAALFIGRKNLQSRVPRSVQPLGD
jgi:hypothetical protein